jgi:hypothetical protein
MTATLKQKVENEQKDKSEQVSFLGKSNSHKTNRMRQILNTILTSYIPTVFNRKRTFTKLKEKNALNFFKFSYHAFLNNK